jgi:hypothetical protein
LLSFSKIRLVSHRLAGLTEVVGRASTSAPTTAALPTSATVAHETCPATTWARLKEADLVDPARALQSSILLINTPDASSARPGQSQSTLCRRSKSRRICRRVV